MGKRRRAGLQQDATLATLPTADQIRAEQAHRELAAWLERRGLKANKLPSWREFKRSGEAGGFYLGPACRRHGRVLFGMGAPRRASDHAPVCCMLHLPAVRTSRHHPADANLSGGPN